VVRTGDRYVLAVLPASRRISRVDLKAEPGETFALASENEIEQLFEDCAPGAIPPIGECYGLDAVVEPSICDQPDVYFVGGDHAALVRVSQTQFAALTEAPLRALRGWRVKEKGPANARGPGRVRAEAFDGRGARRS